MRRILSILFSIMLLLGQLTCAAAAGSTADETKYEKSIEQLNEYLLNRKPVTVSIEDVADSFADLGNYKSSQFFSRYATVLYNVEKGFFMLNEENLQILKLHKPFSTELSQWKAQYPALGTVDELCAYANGRQLEAAGNYAAAKNQFASCLGFLDTLDHYAYANKYAGTSTVTSVSATASANTTVSATASTTIDSFDLHGYSLSNGQITLGWDKHSKAISYKIYRQRTKDESSFSHVATLFKTSTSFTDKNTVKNYNYRYYVEAVGSNGFTALSNQVDITAKADSSSSGSNSNKNNNTNVNANANTNTNTSSSTSSSTNNNTNTSSSTSNNQNENTSQNTNTNNVQQSQSTNVNVQVNLGPEWSSWSEWSTSVPTNLGSNREIETRTVQQSTQVTKYTYTRWSYFNTEYNYTMYSYSEYRGTSYKSGTGKWESKTTDTPLAKTKVISGHQQYSGMWYNENKKTETVLKDVTQYRYRDRLR